jgi:hypothetical protein
MAQIRFRDGISDYLLFSDDLCLPLSMMAAIREIPFCCAGRQTAPVFALVAAGSAEGAGGDPIGLIGSVLQSSPAANALNPATSLCVFHVPIMGILTFEDGSKAHMTAILSVGGFNQFFIWSQAKDCIYRDAFTRFHK